MYWLQVIFIPYAIGGSIGAFYAMRLLIEFKNLWWENVLYVAHILVVSFGLSLLVNLLVGL